VLVSLAGLSSMMSTALGSWTTESSVLCSSTAVPRRTGSGACVVRDKSVMAMVLVMLESRASSIVQDGLVCMRVSLGIYVGRNHSRAGWGHHLRRLLKKEVWLVHALLDLYYGPHGFFLKWSVWAPFKEEFFLLGDNDFSLAASLWICQMTASVVDNSVHCWHEICLPVSSARKW
jgi:hypothetical protein